MGNLQIYILPLSITDQSSRHGLVVIISMQPCTNAYQKRREKKKQNKNSKDISIPCLLRALRICSQVQQAQAGGQHGHNRQQESQQLSQCWTHCPAALLCLTQTWATTAGTWGASTKPNPQHPPSIVTQLQLSWVHGCISLNNYPTACWRPKLH